MKISAHIRILATIQTGSIYYFEEEKLSSSEPHYFVVLDKDPRTEEFLILVCASSQVEKRRQIAIKLGFPKETLVLVSPSECPLFTKDTVIDCNRVFEKTSQSLIEKLEQENLKVCTEVIATDIITKLIQGVLASSQVSEKIQQLLLNHTNQDRPAA
ncbi:MAG: hypothetical protein HYZ51_02335 [Candidatus Doudnabacteria bacterium]|nr:hypothetical protein [Candidatus Doudnabacteria bacterium]